MLLAPLLLTMLVPPSIMPVRAPDGSLTVVICTGDGPLEMRIDPATGEPVRDDGGGAFPDCHWNALRDIALADAPPDGPRPAMRTRTTRQAETHLPPRKLARFIRPPARASPVLI